MKREPGEYSRLTSMQADMLSFLRKRQREGMTPSFSEMQDAMGLCSKSAVFRLLSALEERGYIERLPNRSRAITVHQVAVPAKLHATPFELARVPLSALLEEVHRRTSRKARAVA